MNNIVDSFGLDCRPEKRCSSVLTCHYCDVQWVFACVVYFNKFMFGLKLLLRFPFRRLLIMLTTDEIQFVVFVVLCALSILLNGTFLIAICKSWKIVKRKRITYHVTNLAISDFCVGAGVFCEYITILVAGRKTTLSLIFSKIGWMSVLTSLLAVCLMAIERALCIRKPLTWNTILPMKKILIIMVGNWLLALPLGILMHFYALKMRIIFVVLFYIPIFVTALVYINMYIRISKSNEVDDETQHSSSIVERRNKLLQRKVGNLVLIIALVLVISMAPTLLAIAVNTTCRLLNCKFIETVDMLRKYFYLLSILNFVVNPILYAWRINLYRQAFWKMLGMFGNEN